MIAKIAIIIIKTIMLILILYFSRIKLFIFSQNNTINKITTAGKINFIILN